MTPSISVCMSPPPPFAPVGPKMVKTQTYRVFAPCRPWQDATSVPAASGLTRQASDWIVTRGTFTAMMPSKSAAVLDRR